MRIRKNSKFACIPAFFNSIEESAFSGGAIDLVPGISIATELPFEWGEDWQRWLGEIQTESVKSSNCFVVSQAVSNNPELLDKENREHERLVQFAFAALMLHGIPHYENGRLIISGADVNGQIQVRQVNYAREYVRAAPNDWTLDASTAASAADVLKGVLDVAGTTDSYRRLRRVLNVWMSAAREHTAGERTHSFVRVLDGLTQARAAATFATRVQALLGLPDADASRLQTMYRLRSATCHLDEWQRVLKDLPQGSDATEFATHLSHDVERLATRALREILKEPARRTAYSTNSELRRFLDNLEVEQRRKDVKTETLRNEKESPLVDDE